MCNYKILIHNLRYIHITNMIDSNYEFNRTFLELKEAAQRTSTSLNPEESIIKSERYIQDLVQQ